MNFTSLADIGYFFKSEVLDPILDICRSSERNNDLILVAFVAYVACGQGDFIVDMSDLSEVLKIFSSSTIPCLQACFGTISKTSIVGILFRLILVIGVGICKDEGADSDGKSQKKNAGVTFHH